MMRNLKIKKSEIGQALPIMVLMMFAILAMVALLLDGGSIMSNRRTAQAAADAGAMAGAQRACSGNSDGQAVAEHYAIDLNGATSAVVTVVDTVVTVDATVETSSFFAKILGHETLVATATATAGCFGPMGKSVVPLAWNCRAPSLGSTLPYPFPEDYGCAMQTLSWPDLEQLVEGDVSTLPIEDYDGNVVNYHMADTNVVNESGVPPEQLYIIFDSDKICIEDDPLLGAIQCDLDGDGKKDLQVAGDRGWLYLTADTSNIGDWVDEGPHPNITIESHQWLSGKSGVVVSVLNQMETHGFAGEVVLIPVYNMICENDPRVDTSCVADAHASPPWPAFTGTDDFSEMKNSGPYYHILTFEPFYITCVNSQGNCPGYEYAQTLPGNDDLSANEPVIEGFFLSDVGIIPDIADGCSVNLGNCTISLGK
jgi:Flp pilus assembly protein TadG